MSPDVHPGTRGANVWPPVAFRTVGHSIALSFGMAGKRDRACCSWAFSLGLPAHRRLSEFVAPGRRPRGMPASSGLQRAETDQEEVLVPDRCNLACLAAVGISEGPLRVV
jgi:hypothetical protein